MRPLSYSNLRSLVTDGFHLHHDPGTRVLTWNFDPAVGVRLKLGDPQLRDEGGTWEGKRDLNVRHIEQDGC